MLLEITNAPEAGELSLISQISEDLFTPLNAFIFFVDGEEKSPWWPVSMASMAPPDRWRVSVIKTAVLRLRMAGVM